VAKRVVIAELPDLPEKGDVSDWLASHDPSTLWDTLALGDIPEASFPLDILAPTFRRYTEEGSALLPCPPEMIALPLLASYGAMIGNRAHLAVNPGWLEFGTLWIACIVDPGGMKTPSMKTALRPLRAVQVDCAKRWRLEKQQYLERKASQKGRRGAQEELGEPPTMRSVYTSDITTEALVVVLEHSPGIVYTADELIGWVRRMNQYRAGADKQAYLSLWATDPLKVDRKSTGSAHVPMPCVGIYGGIQPDVVPFLHPANMGRDGFVERILPFQPQVGAKTYRKGMIPPTVTSDLVEHFRTMNMLPDLPEDAQIGDGLAITLSSAAEEIFAAWDNANNALAYEHRKHIIGGFYQKLEAHCLRFALILHLMRHPHGNVTELSVETMRDAIELAEWFRPQIEAFVPLLGQGTVDPSRPVGLYDRVYGLIVRKGEHDTRVAEDGTTERYDRCLHKREILLGVGSGGGIRPGHVDDALFELEERGVITSFVVRGVTKPATTFCVVDSITDKQSNNLTISPADDPPAHALPDDDGYIDPQSGARFPF
jgi:hypothetical protein